LRVLRHWAHTIALAWFHILLQLNWGIGGWGVGVGSQARSFSKNEAIAKVRH
jgi:hypothetical protein